MHAISKIMCSVQLCHNDQGSLRSRVTLKTSLSIEVVEEKYRVNVHRCDAAIKIDSLNFGSRLVRYICDEYHNHDKFHLTSCRLQIEINDSI
jgi:hypothetical protein